MHTPTPLVSRVSDGSDEHQVWIGGVYDKKIEKRMLELVTRRITRLSLTRQTDR